MVFEWCFDIEENGPAIEILRCTMCGWRHDPVMERHQQIVHQPDHGPKRLRRKPRQPKGRYMDYL